MRTINNKAKAASAKSIQSNSSNLQKTINNSTESHFQVDVSQRAEGKKALLY